MRIVIRIIVAVGILSPRMISAQETTPEAILTDTIRAQFIADTFSPLVGEPVALTLIADLPPGAELVAWPAIEAAWGEFVVTESGELQIIGDLDDGQRLRQSITVILWEPGDYETPETLVGYRLPDVDEIYYAPFTPAFFTVPSVLDQTDLVLRPLREQVSMFYIPIWVFGVIGIGVLTFVYAGWRGWIRWRSRQVPVYVPDISIAEQTLSIFHRLNDDTLPAADVVTQAADNLREYVTSRLQINAQERTTRETADALRQRRQLSPEAITTLTHLLEQGDMVKFTAADINAEDSGRYLNRAYQWVMQVEKTLQAEAVEVT